MAPFAQIVDWNKGLVQGLWIMRASKDFRHPAPVRADNTRPPHMLSPITHYRTRFRTTKARHPSAAQMLKATNAAPHNPFPLAADRRPNLL
jgi:hypothetical protein